MKNKLLGIAGTMLLLAGCGYKDNPVPPQSVVPMAIEDLRYQIGNGNVKLTWSYPVKTIKGKAITEIANFQLYRAGIPIDEYCKNCPIPFGAPQSLAGGPSYDNKQRRVTSFVTKGMKPGYKYFFKVCSRTGWLASSSDSNVVSFLYSLPPATPQNLAGKAENGAVNLSWSPVRALSNGKNILESVHYQIFRNGAKITNLLSKTSYSDTSIENDHIYKYTVQAVILHSGEPVLSANSKTVTIIPKDHIAPATLAQPHVVETSEGNKIFWDAVEAGDLAEYRIYRRADNDQEYTLIGTITSLYTIYTDNSISKDTRYHYTVTAVDKTGNESARSQSATTRD